MPFKLGDPAGAGGLTQAVFDYIPSADLTYTYGDGEDSNRVLVGAGALSGVEVWNESALTSLEESVTGGYWEASLDLTGLIDTKWGLNNPVPDIAPALMWPCFGDGIIEVDGEIMSGHADANFAAAFAAVDPVTANDSPVVCSMFGGNAPTRNYPSCRWASVVRGGASSSNIGTARRVLQCERGDGLAYMANSVSWGSGWLDKDQAAGRNSFVGDVAPSQCHAGVGFGGNTNDINTVIRIYRIRLTLYPWPE